MSGGDIKALYSERYSKQDIEHAYAVEFVVRAFLGTYPNLRMDRERYRGSTVLDLGFGDGRNLPLLCNLGFRLHGVEIHEDIVKCGLQRMSRLGIEADLALGTNRHIPFADGFFDFVLACHSCYYVEAGSTFSENRDEIHRVMKPDGVLICSLPMSDSYILEGAERLADGHWRIAKDPYGLRVGTVFRAFDDEQEIVTALSPHFADFRIGFCDDSYWGIRQKVWIVVCRKQQSAP